MMILCVEPTALPSNIAALGTLAAGALRPDALAAFLTWQGVLFGGYDEP
jgi:hypothetical protein